METLVAEILAARPLCEAKIADTECYLARLREEDALLERFLEGVADVRRRYESDGRPSRSEA